MYCTGWEMEKNDIEKKKKQFQEEIIMTLILQGYLILLSVKRDAPNSSEPLKLSTAFTFY